LRILAVLHALTGCACATHRLWPPLDRLWAVSGPRRAGGYTMGFSEGHLLSGKAVVGPEPTPGWVEFEGQKVALEGHSLGPAAVLPPAPRHTRPRISAHRLWRRPIIPATVTTPTGEFGRSSSIRLMSHPTLPPLRPPPPPRGVRTNPPPTHLSPLPPPFPFVPG
jgi:hypothetical protein